LTGTGRAGEHPRNVPAAVAGSRRFSAAQRPREAQGVHPKMARCQSGEDSRPAARVSGRETSKGQRTRQSRRDGLRAIVMSSGAAAKLAREPLRVLQPRGPRPGNAPAGGGRGRTIAGLSRFLTGTGRAGEHRPITRSRHRRRLTARRRGREPRRINGAGPGCLRLKLICRAGYSYRVVTASDIVTVPDRAGQDYGATANLHANVAFGASNWHSKTAI
jgi:hypothetical protein